MKKQFKKLKFLNLMSLGLILFLTSCQSNITLLNPKGMIGQSEKELIIIALSLMLIVVIPVIVMTIVFAIKYRAGNEKAKYTPDWAHSYTIEAVVWIIPLIIILILGTISWETTHSLDPYRPINVAAKPIKIQVVSLDWKWLFIYPQQHIATVNYVAFPVNVPVEFLITSDAPMNSFMIPSLGSQIYAMAGMQTVLHLISNTVGDYHGASTSFSGRGFSHMNFIAHVSTESEFSRWVESAQASPSSLDLATYNQLATPSEDNPVAYYKLADEDLFSQIIHKYMVMPGTHNPIKNAIKNN